MINILFKFAKINFTSKQISSQCWSLLQQLLNDNEHQRIRLHEVCFKARRSKLCESFSTGEETALGAREKWKRWHRWGSGIILIWPMIMCSHVLTDDETEKNVSCYRHYCFDLTGDYTLTRKHRENRETIKTTASDVCLLCPHQMSFSSNFSWAVLALHVFVLVRHPGKVDAEQHLVGTSTRLD